MTESSSGEGYYRPAALPGVSAASLAAFAAIEKRQDSPRLDLKLMTDRAFLPPVTILIMVCMSIFMVYQTILVMISPQPLGFGGDPIESAGVQLPFLIVLFVGTITSGFLLDKIGNTRLLLLGTAISTTGFAVLFILGSIGLTSLSRLRPASIY